MNGSLRSHIESFSPSQYIGVDFQPGNGVDQVVPAEDLVKHFGLDSFDLVVSTEMLEHCKDWKKSIQAIFDVCKADGIILMTARGPGCGYHAYPHDYWRFTVADMTKVFDKNKILYLQDDPQGPGFLSKIQKTAPALFTDFEVMPITQS